LGKFIANRKVKGGQLF